MDIVLEDCSKTENKNIQDKSANSKTDCKKSYREIALEEEIKAVEDKYECEIDICPSTIEKMADSFSYNRKVLKAIKNALDDKDKNTNNIFDEFIIKVDKDGKIHVSTKYNKNKIIRRNRKELRRQEQKRYEKKKAEKKKRDKKAYINYYSQKYMYERHRLEIYNLERKNNDLINDKYFATKAVINQIIRKLE